MDRDSLNDSFLTVAEVAELLKLNQQTVRNWIDQGSLPALKVGRRVRIRRSELERVLQQAEKTAAPQDKGPSAEDFWGGDFGGLAEPVVPEPASAGPDRESAASEMPPPAHATAAAALPAHDAANEAG